MVLRIVAPLPPGVPTARTWTCALLGVALGLTGCGRFGFKLHEIGADDTSTDPSSTLDGGARLDAGATADAGASTDASVAGDANAGAGAGEDAAIACLPAASVLARDTDRDGVLDVYDSDDDDDGRSDADECGYTSASALLNAGFEEPRVDPAQGFVQVLDSKVEGWRSATRSDLVELWSSGHEGVPSVAGAQHTELNTDGPGELHQDVETEPNARWRWALWHRGRHAVDVLDVEIGGRLRTSLLVQLSTSSADWVLYAGELTAPDDDQLRLSFVTVEPQTPDGNLIDEVALEPVCTRDRDGDGCADSEDTDADGDGVPDRSDNTP